MIEFRNYVKQYGDRTILNNITLKLEKGKIHGFVGKNASGKTMLFKAICGFIIPTSGNVCVNGRQIGKDLDFPKKCGVLIEVPGFINNISGFKNLKILASINKTIDDKKIMDTMTMVGLDPNDKRPVKKYSLGMKQKLGIVQAIMEEPELLILDEPMNAIDEESVAKISDIFIELKNKGTTILVASHIKEEIDLLCDDIYKVYNGCVEKL